MNVLSGYNMLVIASYFPENLQKAVQQQTQAVLGQLANENFSREVKQLVRTGKRAKEIINEKQHVYDLVLIGRRCKISQGSALAGFLQHQCQ